MKSKKVLLLTVDLISCFLLGVLQADILIGPFVPDSGNWYTLTNGGFESGVSGWTDEMPSRGVFRATNQLSALGCACAKAIPYKQFTGCGFALRRSVPVMAESTYVLSGFFNTSSLNNSSLYLDLADVSFDKHVTPHYGIDEWQFAWKQFTVAPNVTTINVRLVRDGTVFLEEYGYIDEVAITPIEEFEPPVILFDDVVCNVSAFQRNDTSGLVDIHYDLLDEDSQNYTISINVSDDGGQTWDVPVSSGSLSGDIGPGIEPGEGKHIIWDAGKDLPGVYGTNFKVRIIANDE